MNDIDTGQFKTILEIDRDFDYDVYSTTYIGRDYRFRALWVRHTDILSMRYGYYGDPCSQHENLKVTTSERIHGRTHPMFGSYPTLKQALMYSCRSMREKYRHAVNVHKEMCESEAYGEILG